MQAYGDTVRGGAGMDLNPMSQEWMGFFSALAQVSGGLVGLVFVALTFNPQKLGAGGDPMLGELARVTFSDFLVMLLVSLVMLVPHATSGSVGYSIMSIGGFAAFRIARSLLRLRSHLRAGGWGMVQRFALSVLGHGFLAAAGVTLLAAQPNLDLTGSLLFSAVGLLLLSATRSAWLLVMPERE
jgi:hypothetical protein